ncbi:hypothetical protein Ppa06_43910 [Planomonospora parontospora subsp. parontospora]|uniref:Uncharacterized protein n=2 Tax=Planomonospora parontospora TaxID=58119 RepID=A0AA37BL04_9ACTN|nr:hypothetical protein [Planomonospora parontospora]GGK84608.1 hypothetical protein GCM10010126_49760 [Planomonospora parontospora]GII10593.1 hypothetical protein Ppa06_43910 [Planomonospora parontospora subsp. parontospora]
MNRTGSRLSVSYAEVRSWHRPLTIMVAAMSALVVVASVGLLADGRELLQQSVWAKPLKFGASFVMYGATLAWLIPKLRRARRTMWTVGTVFAVAGLIDVGFIAVQAARGTFSHFNAGTDTFNRIGQQIFSTGVFGLFGASLIVAVMLLFQRIGDAALTWALRAGIGLAVLGMALASFITGWTSSAGPRTVEDAHGNPVPLVGGHGVGAPDGGGMPITNWSTTGGDLRVPHFIGLHSIQVFVLTVLVLTALATRIDRLRHERVRARLTGVVILGYSALFTITAWQALRGQSLVHPDAATWTALAATTVMTALLAALAVTAAHRNEPAHRAEAASRSEPVRRRKAAHRDESAHGETTAPAGSQASIGSSGSHPVRTRTPFP